MGYKKLELQKGNREENNNETQRQNKKKILSHLKTSVYLAEKNERNKKGGKIVVRLKRKIEIPKN